MARPNEKRHWSRQKHRQTCPATIRTGGGDHLYLDYAEVRHDSRQRDILLRERSREHESRLLIPVGDDSHWMGRDIRDAFPDATTRLRTLIAGENKPTAASGHNMPMCLAVRRRRPHVPMSGLAPISLRPETEVGLE